MTPPTRWPKNAETARVDAISACEDARRLLRQAQDEIKRNPDLTRAYIADANALISDVQRLMVQAKVGK